MQGVCEGKGGLWHIFSAFLTTLHLKKILCRIQDENDNSPVFTADTYEITIPENLPVGTTVGSVFAADADAGSNGQVAYSSSPQQVVAVDNRTGDVVLLISPDFETLSMQSVQVRIKLKKIYIHGALVKKLGDEVHLPGTPCVDTELVFIPLWCHCLKKQQLGWARLCPLFIFAHFIFVFACLLFVRWYENNTFMESILYLQVMVAVYICMHQEEKNHRREKFREKRIPVCEFEPHRPLR